MDTDRRQDGTEAEAEGQLRLPPRTLLAIRGLARLDGMTAEELVATAVTVYGRLPADQRSAWGKGLGRDADASPEKHVSQSKHHPLGADRLAGVEAFDRARDAVIEAMRKADLSHLKGHDDILEEAVRATRERGRTRTRVPTEQG